MDFQQTAGKDILNVLENNNIKFVDVTFNNRQFLLWTSPSGIEYPFEVDCGDKNEIVQSFKGIADDFNIDEFVSSEMEGIDEDTGITEEDLYYGAQEIKSFLDYIADEVEKAGAIMGKNETLYEKLKAIVPENMIDTHASDIYVVANLDTKKIIQDYYDDMGIKNQSSVFKDQVTGKTFYEIPFAYANEYRENRRTEAKKLNKAIERD